MQTTFLTVRDLLPAMPPGTRVIAGEAGLGQEVTWVRLFRSLVPALEPPEGGEFVLISSLALEQASADITLARVLRELAETGVAGVGLVGELALEARSIAEGLVLPILSLPHPTNLRELERKLAALIVDHRLGWQEQSLSLYEGLVQLALEGKGLRAMLQHLATNTSKIVVLQDGAFNLIAYAAPPFLALSQEDVAARLLSYPTMSQWAGKKQTAGLLDLPLPGWVQLVTIVRLGDSAAGYLSFIGRAGEIGERERLILQKVVPIVAMEMAKERSISEAEERLRRNFFQTLLSGAFRSAEEMRRQASYLGHHLAESYLALAFGLDEEGRRYRGLRLSEAVERALASLTVSALCWEMEEKVAVLYPAGDASTVEAICKIAARIRGEVSRELAGLPVSVGVGRFYPGLEGLSRSFHEAQAALQVARLLGGNRILRYEELGLYRLLLPLRNSGELASFYQDTLLKLVKYDEEQDTELVKTLEAFLTNNGNLARTARALALHRNSLIYRLRRIAQITGADLDSAEERLKLAVALRIRNMHRAG